MTCTAAKHNPMMSGNASASCANAAFSCAILVILDAMILASIIIFAAGLAGLSILVLVAVLAGGKVNDAMGARKLR